MNLSILSATLRAAMYIVNEVVPMVEDLYGDKSGDAKKKLAIECVKTIYEGTDPKIGFSELESQVGGLIDNIVSFKNDAGEFVKAVKEVVQ